MPLHALVVSAVAPGSRTLRQCLNYYSCGAYSWTRPPKAALTQYSQPTCRSRGGPLAPVESVQQSSIRGSAGASPRPGTPEPPLDRNRGTVQRASSIATPPTKTETPDRQLNNPSRDPESLPHCRGEPVRIRRIILAPRHGPKVRRGVNPSPGVGRSTPFETHSSWLPWSAPTRVLSTVGMMCLRGE